MELWGKLYICYIFTIEGVSVIELHLFNRCTANHPIMRELCQTVQQNHQRSMAMAKGILNFLPPSERKSILIALQSKYLFVNLSRFFAMKNIF
jgi:hypothetical protein